MSIRWADWAHVMWSTRGHWLPGDLRGFRDHDHRVHSTGDYKHRPPPEEHEGLRRHSESLLKATVRLTAVQRGAVGEVLLKKFRDRAVPVRVLSVGAMHVHVLIRPGAGDARSLVGVAKQVASKALRREIPGRMWGQRCDVERINGEKHYRNVVDYILEHESSDAWVWEPERCRAMRAKRK